MKVKISNVIEILDPTEEIQLWCRKNLVVANPEYITRLRMGLYTGKTPSELYLYEMRGRIWVLPFGTLRDLGSMLIDAECYTAFPEAEEVDYKANVALYDYQKDAVNACVSAKYGILKSPAGSGKTQMGIALITALGRRTLWLTHTKDLLKQSYDRAAQYIDSSLLGTIREGKVNISEGVTFATVQTMCRMDLTEYRDYWDVIIVDECHRVCGSPTTMSQFYKVLNALAARHKYGLTATVHRSDGMIASVYALLGHEAYIVPEEAVAGKTMKVTIQTIGTGTPQTYDCIGTDGMINFTKTITYLSEDEERNKLIAYYIAANKDHSCLILTDRINHMGNIISRLPRDMWKDVAAITGAMTSKKDKAQREKAIEDMRSGKKKYLFATYSLAKEGLDIPRLDRLFMASPHRDYAVITQSIGRIARTFPNKETPICYDFVDDIYLMRKFYKQRCTTYRKNGCEIR